MNWKQDIIQEMVRTDSEKLRKTIEESITSLKGRKKGLQDLIASLVIEDAAIKIALGGVNRTGLCLSVFVSAPRSKQHANRPQALIEDRIPLPPLLRMRSKSFLERLYLRDHLSVKEVARMTKISHSTILAALSRFDIPQNGNGHKRPGQIPFGFEYADYQLVKNKAEQEVIRMIRQYRAGGLSLRQIAGQLNEHLIPTKNGGIWQANTVRKILTRI